MLKRVPNYLGLFFIGMLMLGQGELFWYGQKNEASFWESLLWFVRQRTKPQS